MAEGGGGAVSNSRPHPKSKQPRVDSRGFFLLCALAGLSQGVGRECVDVGCGMWEDGGIEVL